MDEFKEFADLLGNLIAKYIDKIDLESLPDARSKQKEHDSEKK